MKVTVDRIEGELLIVVTPEKECVNLSSKLCPDAKEGDILSIEILKEETECKKKEIEDKLEFLKKRNI